MGSFNPNNFLKDSVSKYSHIGVQSFSIWICKRGALFSSQQLAMVRAILIK